MTNDLKNLHLAFIGCGVMGESMIAGLVRKELVDPKNISASHPSEARGAELARAYGIAVYENNAEAARAVGKQANSAVVICVKPQRLARVLSDLAGALTLDQLVVSIVAGARIAHLADALG